VVGLALCRIESSRAEALVISVRRSSQLSAAPHQHVVQYGDGLSPVDGAVEAGGHHLEMDWRSPRVDGLEVTWSWG